VVLNLVHPVGVIVFGGGVGSVYFFAWTLGVFGVLAASAVFVEFEDFSSNSGIRKRFLFDRGSEHISYLLCDNIFDDSFLLDHQSSLIVSHQFLIQSLLLLLLCSLLPLVHPLCHLLDHLIDIITEAYEGQK
jgi:hypothetical protein